MKVIVGLGNPGKEYERTPHNAGFAVLDEMARRLACEFRRSWLSSTRTARGAHGGEDLLLVKPQTYMNRSGSAVSAILGRRGAAAADLIVAVDDADLPMGQIRVRKKGSAGGHKGLKSIIDALQTEEFPRVRVGVGRGRDGGELTGHVLGPLRGEAWDAMKDAADRAAEAVFCVLDHGVDEAMNRFNAKGTKPATEQDEGRRLD